MTIEVKAFHALPCEAEYFRINGKDASIFDFGDYEYGDYDECDDEDVRRWGCYERYFVPFFYDENTEVAEKYGLTEGEYVEVCLKLREVFSIGTCGWCI